MIMIALKVNKKGILKPDKSKLKDSERLLIMEERFMETNRIIQLCIVVKNVEVTARNYADIFGMDMPEIILTDPLEYSQNEYKGRLTNARAKIAFFQMGDIELEILEPNEVDSTWREFLDKNGEGVHHIAFYIKDMKKTMSMLESKGMPVVQKANYPYGIVACMDTKEKLGVILELLERP